METFESVRLLREPLESYCQAILRGLGVGQDAAAATARALSEASLRGVDTHGVRLLPGYVQWIKGGRVRTDARITFRKVAASLGVVDADGGLGHLPSYRATDEAIALAKASGVGIVAVHNTSHHGATGTYALHGSRQGFVVFGFTQSGPGVVAHQGRAPFNGTNPIAFSSPLQDEEPLLLDMATSSIPLNRIYLRRDSGVPLPADVAVDAQGAATTDAHDARSLLPLGGIEYGYKGSGLATMVDLLCTMFTGSPPAVTLPPFNDVSSGAPTPLGHCFIAIDGAAFRGADALSDVTSGLVAKLRACDPVEGGRVLAPGDPEKEEAAKRSQFGVPVDLATWQRLAALADEVGIAVPEIIPDGV